MKISLITMDSFSGCIGLRSVSSCLRQAGHDTELIFLNPWDNFDYDSLFPDGVLEELTRIVRESDLIGISFMTNGFKKAVQITSHLKKLNKPLIWGGIHVTSCPDECIEYPDMICIGEGEEAVCELAGMMEKGLDYSDTRNFWFKKERQIIKNQVRPLIQDLDSLPFPDYDLDKYHVLAEGKIIKGGAYYEKMTGVLMHTMRGCPYHCSYCCNSFLQKLYSNKGKIIRKMSIKAIINGLEQLKDKFPNLKRVWFTDDSMFVRSREELEMFRDEYKEKIGLPFMCYTTPDAITEEKLELLLSAGLNKIEMGIQTGSEGIGKNIYNRAISNTAVKKAAALLNKYKTKMDFPNYQIMFHNPYETMKDLVKTIGLVRELAPPFILQVFPIQLFPASELYEKAKKDGLLKENNLVNYHDHKRAFELNNKEMYLNFLIYLMSGITKSNTGRMGQIPRLLLPVLTNKTAIGYFRRHDRKMKSLIKEYFDTRHLPSQKIRKCRMIMRFFLK